MSPNDSKNPDSNHPTFDDKLTYFAHQSRTYLRRSYVCLFPVTNTKSTLLSRVGVFTFSDSHITEYAHIENSDSREVLETATSKE